MMADPLLTTFSIALASIPANVIWTKPMATISPPAFGREVVGSTATATSSRKITLSSCRDTLERNCIPWSRSEEMRECQPRL